MVERIEIEPIVSLPPTVSKGSSPSAFPVRIAIVIGIIAVTAGGIFAGVEVFDLLPEILAIGLK